MFDAWLHDFYKECGREVTLAYTTLNQMKNWAIVVQGTIIAAVAAFGRSALSSGGSNAIRDIGVAVVVGAVLAHLFTLRFMVRSTICYVNLLRWNTLQRSIIEFEMKVTNNVPVAQALQDTKLETNIQQFYFGWASTISRAKQLSSVLKLGFALLVILPAVLVAWGAYAHWDVSLVRGLTAFAVGGTLIELVDFLRYRDFDTPERAARRKSARPTFPAPSGKAADIVLWLLNAGISSWIVFGFGWLKSLHVHQVIPSVLIGSTIYLIVYIFVVGLMYRPAKLSAHLLQLLAAILAIVALAALVSFSRISVVIAAAAGLLLAVIALARRKRSHASSTPPTGGVPPPAAPGQAPTAGADARPQVQ